MSANPLSWIYSALGKFHFCNFVAVRSISSLSEFRFVQYVHKSLNPCYKAFVLWGFLISTTNLLKELITFVINSFICRRGDLNPQGFYSTRPSNVRVYRFRHYDISSIWSTCWSCFRNHLVFDNYKNKPFYMFL